MRSLHGALLLAALASCDGAASLDPAPRRTEELPRAALHFVDVTSELGLDFVHDAGFSTEKQLPETMGAGAAIVDVDEDGDLDLYCVQSGPLPLAADRSSAPPNRLYLNDGAGHFEDATEQSGDAAHRGYGMGVAAGDANGDGHVDLFVTNFGPDVLLAGDGTGRFRDVTERSRIQDARWTAGALFFDPEGDGDLDLYVTAYLELDLTAPEWCGERREGWRSYCHPERYEGLQDRSWRNRGDGTFEDATEAAGLADSFGRGLGAVVADVEQDGDVDLYVANDGDENRLWLNRGDGTFEDATLLSGTGVDELGTTEAGMGLAAGNVDGDGRIDLFVTNFDDESDTLYRNDGDGLFTDLTAECGLEAVTRLPVGFGVVLEDLDGDLDLDLAIANGHIIDNIHLYHDGKTWAQRPLLFANDGRGGFEDVTDSSGDFGARAVVGRGLYAGDLDRDGDLDLVMTECGGPARILRNESPLVPAAFFSGLPPGATVEIALTDGRRAVRAFGPAPSYFGASAPELHVALGPARVAELRARWRAGDWHRAELDPPLGPGRYRIVLEGELLVCRKLP